jgi:hypothetical protein
MIELDEVEDAKKCLVALGAAWRKNWEDFDGGALTRQLDEIIDVLDGNITYEEFCNNNGIDTVAHCWTY